MVEQLAEKVPDTRHRVLTRFHESGQGVLELVGRRMPVLPCEPTGEAQFEVTAGRGGAVITALSAKGEPAWSIARPAGGGASWWDHATRQCMAWGAEAVRCDDAATPAADIAIDRKARVATLRWSDPALGDVRLCIRCARTTLPPAVAERVLSALYGNGCCVGGFHAAQVAALGAPRRCELFVGSENTPIVTTELSVPEVIKTTSRTYSPPKGFHPIPVDIPADVPTVGDSPGGSPPVTPVPASPAPGRTTQALDGEPTIGRNRQALEAEDILTPGCLAPTRLGPMVGVLHQDLLDNVRAAINLVAPHLGTVTLAGGTLTVPWLSALAAADLTSGGTGPGSGLFTILRQNRTLSPQLGGGGGVLDRLAWRLLTARDPVTGRRMLQQQAADGTLAATLTRWGIPPAIEAVLLSNDGDMFDTRLSDADRSVLVEAYEVIDLGTITIPGMPSAPPPILWPVPPPGGPNRSLVTLTITGITGTMTFTNVGLPPLVTNLAIGANGSVDVTLVLPATTLAATIARATTPRGTGILIGAALSCLIIPFACATVSPLALLLLAILNDLARISATITSMTLSFRVEFAWNPGTRHVEPTVTMLGASGGVTVTTTSSTPGSIASAFNSVLVALGNALGAWPSLTGVAVAAALQSTLRSQGVRFPLGITSGLTAMNGGAQSTPNGTLVLSSEVEPIASTVAQPWITQVPPASVVRNRAETTHFSARRELNPLTITGTRPFPLSVGTYGGLALTQNVLNSYVYARWRAGAFNLDLRFAPQVTQLVDLLPAGLFGASPPGRISVWPATSPRLELAPEGLHASEVLPGVTDPVRKAQLEAFSTRARPLVAYFDDVRVCFDASAFNNENNPLQSGQWEFSFNFRTTATLDLRWPFALELRTDAGPVSVRLTEVRSMEMADGALLSMPLDPAYESWEKLAMELAILMAQRHDASSVEASQPTTTWQRPNPFVVQTVARDMVTLELLAGRKTLTILPMLRTPLLELVDGSGSPYLASTLGVNAPITIGTLTRAQGTTLRRNLGPLLDVAGLLAFPGP